MARTSRSMLSAPRLLGGTTVLLVLLALLPNRAISWVAELSRPVTILLGPLNWTLKECVQAVSGGSTPGGPQSPEVADLRRSIDEYKFELLNIREENERLRKQIQDLQKTLALNPEIMRPVYAPIIGGGADLSAGLLKAKAGEREGVIPNSVAVVEGVHLVGRVTRVESRYCLILPITQKASRGIKGVIMIGDQPGPFCDLVPTGAGTLKGRVFFEEGTRAPELKPDMLVRLDDPEWPASARMLVIGRIVEVVPLPQQPNRPVVTVKPKFLLDKISEVVIRVPTEAPSPSAATPGGSP